MGWTVRCAELHAWAATPSQQKNLRPEDHCSMGSIYSTSGCICKGVTNISFNRKRSVHIKGHRSIKVVWFLLWLIGLYATCSPWYRSDRAANWVIQVSLGISRYLRARLCRGLLQMTSSWGTFAQQAYPAGTGDLRALHPTLWYTETSNTEADL